MYAGGAEAGGTNGGAGGASGASGSIGSSQAAVRDLQYGFRQRHAGSLQYDRVGSLWLSRRLYFRACRDAECM